MRGERTRAQFAKRVFLQFSFLSFWSVSVWKKQNDAAFQPPLLSPKASNVFLNRSTGIDVVLSGCSPSQVHRTLDRIWPFADRIDTIHVYSKCGKTLELGASADKKIHIVKIVNRGREGHTYLYHIVSNWNNLSKYIVFLQDSPTEHFFPGISLDAYIRNRPFFPLSGQLLMVGNMTFHRMRDGFDGIHRCHSPPLVDRSYWERRNLIEVSNLSQTIGRWGNSSAYMSYLGSYLPGKILHKGAIYDCSTEVAFGGIGPWACNWVPMMFPWLRYGHKSSSSAAVDIAYGWSEIFNSTCPEVLYYVLGSQFTVARESIKAVHISRYLRAIEYLSGDEQPYIYHVELFFWYLFGLDSGSTRTLKQPFVCDGAHSGDSDI